MNIQKSENEINANIKHLLNFCKFIFVIYFGIWDLYQRSLGFGLFWEFTHKFSEILWPEMAHSNRARKLQSTVFLKRKAVLCKLA